MEFTLIFLLRKFNNLNQKTRYIHINNIKIKSFNQRNFLQQHIEFKDSHKGKLCACNKKNF